MLTQWAGLYQEAQYLYVNRGLATLVILVNRMLPELTIIELKRA
jgi:predicted MPP superfamily phosphohydrolase